MISDSTISSDLGKYLVIIDGTNFMTASENSWGVCHGVPHCRTSTMTYSRTLVLLVVEK